MNEHKLQIRRRNLPHWTLAGSTYFVTFRATVHPFSIDEGLAILKHVEAGHGQFYWLVAGVVMPDHVHMLLRPFDGFDLSRIMKGTKWGAARAVNELRNRTGRVWQDESWDRIVRDEAEFDEKITYMANNPIKAGLVDRLKEYDGWVCHLD